MHFVHNSNYNANDPNRGKLYKVRGVVEFLVDRFKNVYKLTQHISTDEELLLLSRKKSGNDNENLELKNRIGKTGVILVPLAKDLFGLGFQLYVDDWYTSEALCNYLHEYQACATGTARKN